MLLLLLLRTGKPAVVSLLLATGPEKEGNAIAAAGDMTEAEGARGTGEELPGESLPGVLPVVPILSSTSWLLRLPVAAARNELLEGEVEKSCMVLEVREVPEGPNDPAAPAPTPAEVIAIEELEPPLLLLGRARAEVPAAAAAAAEAAPAAPATPQCTGRALSWAWQWLTVLWPELPSRAAAAAAVPAP